jgi:hypothetical protein
MARCRGTKRKQSGKGRGRQSKHEGAREPSQQMEDDGEADIEENLGHSARITVILLGQCSNYRKETVIGNNVYEYSYL